MIQRTTFILPYVHTFNYLYELLIESIEAVNVR